MAGLVEADAPEKGGILSDMDRKNEAAIIRRLLGKNEAAIIRRVLGKTSGDSRRENCHPFGSDMSYASRIDAEIRLNLSDRGMSIG
jgi:hypothetical protein